MNYNSGNVFPGLPPPPMGLPPAPGQNGGFPPPPGPPMMQNSNPGLQPMGLPGLPPIPSENQQYDRSLPPFNQGYGMPPLGNELNSLPPMGLPAPGGSSGGFPPMQPSPTNSMGGLPPPPGNYDASSSGLPPQAPPLGNSSNQNELRFPPVPGQSGSPLTQASSNSAIHKSRTSKKHDYSDYSDDSYDYDYSSSESSEKPKKNNQPGSLPPPPGADAGAPPLPGLPKAPPQMAPPPLPGKPDDKPFPHPGKDLPPPPQKLDMPPFPKAPSQMGPPPIPTEKKAPPLPPKPENPPSPKDLSSGGLQLPTDVPTLPPRQNPPPFNGLPPPPKPEEQLVLPPFNPGPSTPPELQAPPKPTPPPFAGVPLNIPSTSVFDSKHKSPNMPALPPMPALSSPTPDPRSSPFSSNARAQLPPFSGLPPMPNDPKAKEARKDSLPPFAGLPPMPVDNRPKSDIKVEKKSGSSESSDNEDKDKPSIIDEQDQDDIDVAVYNSSGIADYESTFNRPLPLPPNPDNGVPAAPFLQALSPGNDIMTMGLMSVGKHNESRGKQPDDIESILNSFRGKQNQQPIIPQKIGPANPPKAEDKGLKFTPKRELLDPINGPEGIEIPRSELTIMPYAPPVQTSKVELIPPPDETMIFGFTGPVVRANVLSSAAGQVCAIPGNLIPFDSEPPPFTHPYLANVISLPAITPHTPVRGARYAPNMGTLQAFIDSQPPLSIIEIPAGKYNESLFIRKSLFIRGAGVELYASGDFCLNVTAPEVFIEGIKFVSQPKGQGSSVQNCAFIAKQCAFIGGITAALSLNGKTYATFDHCSFSDAAHGLIVLRSACAAVFFSEFRKLNGNAVYANDQARLHAEGLTIQQAGIGFDLSRQTIASIIKCQIQDIKESGIRLQTITSDIYIGDTKFINCNTSGLILRQNSRASVAGCEFSGCGRSMINMSPNSRLISFKNKFSGSSPDDYGIVISDRARLYSNDDSFTGKSSYFIAVSKGHLYCRGGNFTSIEGEAVVLDHGKGQFVNCLFTSIKKSSIVAQVSIVKCYTSRFTKSGGPMLRALQVEGFIKHSSFSACSGTAIMLDRCESNFEISDVEVTGSSNGAMRMNMSSPKVIDCQFKNNGENGIVVETDSKALFEFCVFAENRGRGITVVGRCCCTFNNCLVNGNEAAGADIHSDTTFSNCTFTSNEGYNVNIEEGSVSMVLCNLKLSAVNLRVAGPDSNADLKFCNVIETKAGPGICVEKSARLSVSQTKIIETKHANIAVQNSANATITNCTMSLSQGPACVVGSDNSTIKVLSSTLSKAQCGFNLTKNSNLVCLQSKISQCTQGIRAQNSSINVEECEIFENKDGMRLMGCRGFVKKSSISGNNGYGIVLDKCRNNMELELNSYNINKQDNVYTI